MKDIINAYQGYRVTNDINELLKKELDMTIVELMVLNEISKTETHLSKTDLEERLGLSKSISQKVTKQLRKNGMIIKDRDIDNESHVILSMNNEMKQKAKSLFERVDELYQDYKNPPEPKEDAQPSEQKSEGSDQVKTHHENPNNKFDKKHHKK